MAGDSAPEEHFGPYIVYERLGIGGMATVHRALEHAEDGSERIVALKRLIPHLAEDASFIKSFVREAKLASMLDHINIVQIYELGRVGTEYFISMEYIDGRDVRRLLRHARKVTGPPPIYVTVGLMLQLCDALEYAHNRVDEEGHPLGLVHRDISPSNLIVTNAGTLKIIDFGIAKAQSSQLRTQTGRVKGKLAYMAPEAVSGTRDLDARSDVWACGVILHELITARPLFASKNEYQTLLRVQRGDIAPPSGHNSECPPELDAIVFHALARDPDQRLSSAAELREALLAFKKQYGLSTSFADVAAWIEWAFGEAPPTDFGGDTAMTGHTSRIHTKTPRPPRNTEEDEAVEVVWGSGNNESENGPVVLEEVPDVSSKRGKRDTQDDEPAIDDIPTPLPSHGVLPSIYNTKPEPSRQGPVVPMPARSKIPTGMQPVSMPRTTTGPQPLTVPRTTTGQPPTTSRTKTGPQDASRSKRGTAPGVTAPPRAQTKGGGDVTAVDSPHLDARLAALREQESPDEHLEAPTILQHAAAHGPTSMRAGSRAETSLRAGSMAETSLRAGSMGDLVATNPAAAPMSEEELFGHEAAEVLASVSEQVEAMSTQSSMRSFREEPTTNPQVRQLPMSVPIVRFSKTVPPPNMTSTPMSTKPGLGGGLQVLPAPASERSKRATTAPPPVAIIAPQTSNKKILLFALGGVVLAGGTAAIVAVSMGGASKPSPAADLATAVGSASADGSAGSAAAPAAPAIGKVKFMLEPTDAEILIDGAAVHTGSPWLDELPAGNHQIEIHKAGYKAWLTTLELSATETAMVRVALEPITTTSDATLMISTTPPGLDVYIDGALFADKTPIKTTMTVGQHKLSIKQAGVEVWQQNVNAEASSDYEFNPLFTDEKKRERAQRPPPMPPKRIDAGSAAIAPAGTGSAGSGSATASDASAAGSGSAKPATTTPKLKGTTPTKSEGGSASAPTGATTGTTTGTGSGSAVDSSTAPKSDAPKPDAPKADTPKTDAPKTDAPSTGSGSLLDKPTRSDPNMSHELK